MSLSEAKCLGLDPNTFFPEADMGRRAKNGPPKDRDFKEAQVAHRICWGGDGDGECPIREECLDMALAYGDFAGVHGGMTEKQKRAINRKRRHA